jgi:hypothetical protein
MLWIFVREGDRDEFHTSSGLDFGDAHARSMHRADVGGCEPIGVIKHWVRISLADPGPT